MMAEADRLMSDFPIDECELCFQAFLTDEANVTPREAFRAGWLAASLAGLKTGEKAREKGNA